MQKTINIQNEDDKIDERNTQIDSRMIEERIYHDETYKVIDRITNLEY